MSEARCLVCGSPLGDLMSHVIAARHGECLSEVCSDECYIIYYTDPDSSDTKCLDYDVKEENDE